MTLNANPKNVTDVLLADGWHTVDRGTFEYLDEDGHPFIKTGRGSYSRGDYGKHATDFRFTEDGLGLSGDMTSRVAGPLTAILAVRY